MLIYMYCLFKNGRGPEACQFTFRRTKYMNISLKKKCINEFCVLLNYSTYLLFFLTINISFGVGLTLYLCNLPDGF